LKNKGAAARIYVEITHVQNNKHRRLGKDEGGSGKIELGITSAHKKGSAFAAKQHTYASENFILNRNTCFKPCLQHEDLIFLTRNTRFKQGFQHAASINVKQPRGC
jgi:hypothetical protein